MHTPDYVGTTWANTNPHYQIDLRRKVAISGTLSFGFGANEFVDDVADIYVNGVREFAAFPSGGAPNPHPGQGNGVTITLDAGDEILFRFINLGFIGGFEFNFQTPTLPTVSASPDNVVGVSGVPGGTNILNVLANDTVEGGPATSANADITLVGTLPTRLNFDEATGNVSVLPGTSQGTYTFSYEICQSSDTSSCETTTVSVGVVVPTSNGQTCPAATQNKLKNPDFTSNFTDWVQTGPNAGGLTLVSYTSSPGGVAYANVVREDGNNITGALSQTISSGISAGGNSTLLFDFAWNNPGTGNATIPTFKVSGVSVLEVNTTTIDDSTIPADATFLNGASGSIAGTSFGVNSAGKIPVASTGVWDLLAITIDLPSGLSDAGDVEIDYSMGRDDWLVDNMRLCSPAIANLTAVKTVESVGNNYAIPGNDVIYNIEVTNEGTGSVDDNSLFIVDTLPTSIVFFNGDLNGTDPGNEVITFTESGSSLTFEDNVDVGYSNLAAKPVNFAQCNYSPSAGYDSDVLHICFRPQGSMAEGDPNPQFTVSFRAQIK